MIATWYGIVSFMLIIYVVLDGRNFGAGMLHWLVARTPEERRQVIAAIGPLWSWHEVWLVGFGGTLLAVFPTLSGLGFCRLLPGALSDFVVSDLARDCPGSRRPHQRPHVAGVLGFRLRRRQFPVWPSSSARRRATWRAAFRSMRTAISPWRFSPISTFAATWACSTGTRSSVAIFAAVMLAAHGATYLTLKTEGPVHDRSESYAKWLWTAIGPLFVIVSVETWFIRPDLTKHGIENLNSWAGMIVVIVSAFALFPACGIVGK